LEEEESEISDEDEMNDDEVVDWGIGVPEKATTGRRTKGKR
jgi:hypothetical protein